ncbi:MAG: DUF4493 domain-containing protein [Muribaculaceae bacterium]|nr:DUF4493 domain-containing protein [Muribaculaceae bacterium]
MNKILVGMLCSSLVMGLASCGEDAGKGSTATGRISPTTEVSRQLVTAQSRSESGEESETRESRAIYDSHENHLKGIDASRLGITLKDADGNVVGQWESLGAYEPETEYSVGRYTMEASLGSESADGFEAPYFKGVADVTVKENETTKAILTAELANAGVAITFTDKFKGYFSDYRVSVETSAGNTYVITADETRPLFVAPGTVNLTLDAKRPTGEVYTVSAGSFTAAAKTVHGITMELDGDFDKAVLTVAFDETVSQEPLEIDLSEELATAGAPYMTLSGFESGKKYEYVFGNLALAASEEPQVHITSKAGLKSAKLTINGKAYELLNAGDAAELTGKGLKLIGVEDGAKMSRVDFKGYMAQLQPGETTFEFTVTDKADRQPEETASIGFICAVDELKYELVSIQQDIPSVAGATAEGIMTFNGSDPKGQIVVKILNERGAYDVVNPEYVSTGTKNEYKFAVELPALRNISLGLASTAMEGNDATSPTHAPKHIMTTNRLCPDFTLSPIENDVWAWEGVLKASVNDPTFQAIFEDYLKDSNSALQFSASANGSVATARVEGKDLYVDVKSITPSATPAVVKVTGKLASGNGSGEFTPEAAAQLPNWNLNAEAKINGSASNWENYEFEGWGTNNAMTTSQGGNYGYVRISGTIPENNGKSGKGVRIRTCGWGQGNSATGSNGTSGACKYTDAGLLHLGSTRTARPSGYGENDNKTNSTSTGPVTTDDLDCGVSFASRPTALSFWYKYAPKNSADKGFVEIWVKDATGNILSHKTKNLDAKSSYTQETIQLDYPAKCEKGAKIYVKFLSSYSMEYIKRTDSNFSGPGFGNLKRGTFMGSQLTVDEIELIYNK